MARDVNDIVVLGFGSWSDVNGLPTLGFGIGSVTVPDVPGIEYRATDQRTHYKADDRRLHYRADDKRPHYTSDGTD